MEKETEVSQENQIEQAIKDDKNVIILRGGANTSDKGDAN